MRVTADVLPAGNGSGGSKGGLAMLFEMVLGGLVGTSPHMISASVMALARLLHQFANELGGARPCPAHEIVLLMLSSVLCSCVSLTCW